MNDIKLMIGVIEKEARQKADSIKAEAELEARRITKEGRIQIQKKRNSILDDYKRKANEIAERAQAEIRAKSGQMVLAARQDVINEAIASARELFAKRSEQEDVELLLKVLDKSVADAGGERPVVIVPQNRLAAAQAALGSDTRVEAGNVNHGFILSFEHYNVNYETATRFEYWQEELEALAASCLFDGDGDGEA